MSEQVWSEWIEHKPGDPCPIAWAKHGEWQSEGAYTPDLGASCYVTFWQHHRVTYRYRLDCAPAGFVPPGAEKPWYPPQQPGFGPWVEWAGGKRPVPSSARVSWICLVDRVERRPPLQGSAGHLDWQRSSEEPDSDIVAYAVKLEDQPTQEQVEATQQPWSLDQDAADWAADSEAQNRPMFDADDVGVLTGKWGRFNARQAWQKPTAAPGFMVRDVRSSGGLLTVREADHRMGLWS